MRNPGLLAALLKEFNIDIWFTVEGTAAIGTKSQVLDGDLLSAATGTIVIPQVVAARNRARGPAQPGMDFGLDGVASPRDPKEALETLYFSTEHPVRRRHSCLYGRRCCASATVSNARTGT